MQSSGQEQQNPRPSGSVIVAMILGFLALCCFVASITIIILNNFGLLRIAWSNYLAIGFNTFGTLLGVLSVVFPALRNFFQWILSSTHLGASGSSVPSTTYSNVSSLSPPTDTKSILQREEAVKQIYKLLMQPEITAIVLTGIAGIGKSTLAALVYHYVENQRHQRWRSFRRGKGPFAAETLWLKVDPSKKMIDIAGTLFQHLGKLVPPNFNHLSPQSQALALTKLLATTKKPRLIILDQFDTLFNIHTEDAQREHPDIGEWLDALNSQRCKCKILFTSCSWLQGTQVHLRTHMQEYHVSGVSISEGTELLKKHRVEGSEAEIGIIIGLCDGHMLAITELINLLQKYQLSLSTFLQSEPYFQLWRRNIALHLLKDLYTRQLDALERKLLSAFTVYRVPVPLEAAEAVLDSEPTPEILKALDVLLTQHLLRPSGEGDYELHPIVAHYIQYDLEESDEQNSYRPSLDTHIKAANYCLEQAKETCPPQGQRRNIRDVRFLVEALRQQCQSEQWQNAYELMRRENIPTDLRNWRENTTLLNLYQLLLPLDKWHPQDAQTADIYSKLGEIHTEMINTDSNHVDEALQYLKRSLALYNHMEDYKGQYVVLRNIGKFYSKQNQYKIALAFFLQAEKLLRETRGSGEEEVATYKEELRRQVGEEQYAALFHEVEPQAEQLVEQILS